MSIVSVEDLAIAYRKVKADLFYFGNPRRIDLLEFESNLEPNLKKICQAYEEKDINYFMDISSGHWYYPKSIVPSYSTNDNNKTIVSNPNILNQSSIIKKYEVRIVEKLPIAFHVITTLWINAIGYKFDSELSSNSYGNRIRYDMRGRPNLYALGTFTPYLSRYRKWRDEGLKTIRANLNNKKKVIAITADFTAFYHNIAPDFILDPTFLNKLNINLDGEQKTLTELIIKMLIHWANQTPLKRGLPVGCAISAVIANSALVFLDRYIEKDIRPLYYGRYVDDIFLVIENINELSKQEDIWCWIQKNIQCLSEKQHNNNISNNPLTDKKRKKKECIYLNYSRICKDYEKINFGNLVLKKEKSKLFVLDYPSGITFLDSLENQIKELSSEWRLLPELPEAQHIPSMLLSVSTKNGEDSDNLRTADSLSMRRALFAMKLADFESYCQNLSSNSWKKQRHIFLKTILHYFTKPEVLFEHFRFFPRIFSIAMECEDYSLISQLLSAIHKQCMILKNKPCIISGRTSGRKLTPIQFKTFLNYMSASFYESIVSSVSSFEKENIKKINGIIKGQSWMYYLCANRIDALHKNLFLFDLANKPFRHCFNPYHDGIVDLLGQSKIGAAYCYSTKNNFPIFFSFVFNDLLHLNINKLFFIWPVPRHSIPKAFFFPTRPFNMREMYVITNKPFQKTQIITNLMWFLRGYSDVSIPIMNSIKSERNLKMIDVQDESISSFISVAVTSWKTSLSSWVSSLKRQKDSDSTRYGRLSHLFNQIIKSNHKINYIVFPELSIPPLWFLSLSKKMQYLDISLIGGVEYIHKKHNILSNQVWCSLIQRLLGFSQSIIFIHDKDSPAIHEKKELEKNGKKIQNHGPRDISTIIKHGDFYFGILICSELTNIDYRARFRGKVDAVFVPEWNSDTTMFGSLVKSAAYDIHAYIIQCNDRQYGDTRIRIPAKDHYNRDIVRIKGGEEDYFVVGKLDINTLRKFQSAGGSPNNKKTPFKPVPSGFIIAPYRKV